MRWMFIGVWIIAVVSVTSFVWFTRVPQGNQHVYYTSVISAGDGSAQMTVYGKIWIDKETTLVPLSDGNVSEVSVKPGDSVKAGQVLALLDLNPEDLIQYEKLKALTADTGSVEALNHSLEEITKLEKRGFYDAPEAAKKRSEVYSSLSQLMSYRSNLQKQFDQTQGKIIRAPFDGVVTDVRLRVGQRVSLKDEKVDVAVTVAPVPLKVGVELEVSDELLPKIVIDQELDVHIPLAQTSSFKGKVQSIAHQAYDDKRKRYFKVLGEVYPTESSVALASGMKVVVNVHAASESDLTWIPKAALDIHIEDKNISARMNYVQKISRGIASSKGDDFKQNSHDAQQDNHKDQSSTSRLVSNEAFPLESQVFEIYLLTADNRVIQASIQKVRESGEMIAVQGKDLRGMRVITHYRPKETLW